jgi:hypothetical protein
MTRRPGHRPPATRKRIQALIATLSAVVLSVAALVVAAAPAHAAPVLLSQGQPTTASSEQSTSFPPSAATDGNTGTRWSSAFSDPQWLEVDLGSSAQISSVTLDWEAAYATAFQIQVSNDNTNWTSIYSTTTGTGGNQSLTVSGTGRYVRMYGTARATQYGYSLWEFDVYGTASSAASCGTTDAALNRPTTASSLENSTFPASAATDGNTGTRWSSAFSDPQWLEVDLGSAQSVCGVALDWEAAYATAFQIQVSNDNANWTSIYSTTTGTGGNQSLTVSGTGRYVRMYGTARATQYGYSLWEFDVYTTGGSTASPSPTGSASPTSTPTGSGAPPASFWGNTSAIPAAGNVLEVAITNQTNGQYPDSEVYWSFNGQEKSIAQQPYIDMAANSAGRMYFYLGSPNSQYYDFIEFTVGSASINVDTTRVDRFGLKLALLVHSHDGTEQEVGENYATFQESRSATFQRFQNSVPTAFKDLATINAPYGIPSPGNDPAFQPGGAYAGYFNSALAAAGDTSDTSLDVFGCAGTLSGNPTLCAALNRGVAQLPTSQQSNPSLFYQTAPANYYAQFWHQNSINGVQYGFPYDDVDGQSSDLSVANPQYMVVAVGW